MTATNPKLAKFKYRHRDPVVPGWVGLVVAVVGLFLIGAALATGNPAVAIATVIAVIAAFALWPRRRILLTPRYMVCGHTIVYYANVRKMVLKPGDSLSLYWGKNGHFRMECGRFPTNARKSHKIAANKRAKFEKVSEKVIKHVLLYSPTVEAVGIGEQLSPTREAAA